MVKQEPDLKCIKCCNYGRNKTPQRVYLHTNLGSLYMGAKAQEEKAGPWALKGQLTTSPSAICLPDQGILPALAVRAWPSRRRGSHASPLVPIFFLCWEALRPWHSSHLGNTKTLFPLLRSLLSTGRANTFTINCSGFDQHGVDPVAFQTVFKQKDFRPVINYSIPTQVNISFTLSAILEVVSFDYILSTGC